jgi:hypothetical protein
VSPRVWNVKNNDPSLIEPVIGICIGKPPLPKLSSQRTLRWRGLDLNF